MNIQLSIFGNKHTDVASTLLSLGHLSIKLEAFEEAENFYQDAYDVLIQLYKPSHPNFIQYYMGLGTLQLHQNEYQNALSTLDTGLTLIDQNFKKPYKDRSEGFRLKTETFMKLGDMSESFSNIKLAIEENETLGISNDLNYELLGIILKKIGNTDLSSEQKEYKDKYQQWLSSK